MDHEAMAVAVCSVCWRAASSAAKTAAAPCTSRPAAANSRSWFRTHLVRVRVRVGVGVGLGL
eukprot:scaffold41555_cov33-Phaeocystis_antarctica.AAC.1